MDIVLVTGSSGLIGSEVCIFFAGLDYKVHGIDNNQRAAFFGPQGDTRWNQFRLQRELPGFEHHELDVRDRQGILTLVKHLPRRLWCTLPPNLPTIWRRLFRSTTSTPTLWGP